MRRSHHRSFCFFSVVFSGIFSGIFSWHPSSASAQGVSYDGSKFSQIPVLAQDPSGSFKWTLLDPSTQKVSLFTTQLGRPGDGLIIANWLYKDVTSAGVVSGPRAASGNRLVWTIRTKFKRGTQVSFQTLTKYLGRPGDLIITGGDFDGDGFADALVVKNVGGNWKWGLRSDFFLTSYNAGLNVNRAYFNFGKASTDRPFFLRPDNSRGDWFALLRPAPAGGSQVLLQQPFTKEKRVIEVGEIPDTATVPLPVREESGSDIMAFHGQRGNDTHLVFKDLSGSVVAETHIPADGDVTVGDYGPGPGQEVAVSSAGRFFIYNPMTDRLETMDGPRGLAGDAININTVR